MIRRLLVNRFWNRTHRTGGIPTWTRELAVRRCLNRRVSGSEGVWPVEWFAREIVTKPFPRALSLGCGGGGLERDLMSKGLCESVLGLDISDEALELARREAREAGYSTLTYERADLDHIDLEADAYEAVFVHQALHHVRELEACLDQVARTLKADGIFYIDESKPNLVEREEQDPRFSPP